MQLPALRARANCSLLPQTIDSSIIRNRIWLENLAQWYVPNVIKPLPPKDTSHMYFQGDSFDKPWSNDPSGNGCFGYW